MKKCKLALFLIISIHSFVALSETDHLSVTLRQHSSDKNKIGKPALIQYTNPDDRESSYLLDAALKGIYAPSNSELEFSGAIEAHKNSLMDKKQDTLTLGFAASSYLKKWGLIPIPDQPEVRLYKNNLFGDVAIKYQIDNENQKESVLTVAELSGLIEEIYLNEVSATSNFPAYWSPILGIEYEKFVKSDAGQTGDVGRYYGNLEIGAYPFFNNLDGRLALAASYSHWQDFAKDEALAIEDDSHVLKKISMLYRLTPEESNVAVSISLSWLDGEDPRNKMPLQKYTEFGIGILY